MVRLLQERGDDVVVIDDLVTGDAARVNGAPLLEFDLADPGAVRQVERALGEYGIEAVIHFAARKQVGESVERPAWYFQQNVGSLANVLIAMKNEAVDRLVFSSSAAVYGAASEGVAGHNRVDETSPTVPVSPYGETKLIGEWLVSDAARGTGLSATSLRYFNVAGAGWPELGDSAVLNLVPMVFERLDAGKAPIIFGDDYDTVDGTCVRDYVHVLDLAEAHLAALDRLSDPGHRVFNVGTGVGSSVRQVIDVILAVSGIRAVPEIAPRRAGDPDSMVASVERIRADLGWSARYGLDEIVASAWRAHRAPTLSPSAGNQVS